MNTAQDTKPPPMEVVDVKIAYFKDSGKYYASGTHIAHFINGYGGVRPLFEIYEETVGLIRGGNGPGLVKNHSDFYAILTCPDHPHDHQHLYIPKSRQPTTA